MSKTIGIDIGGSKIRGVLWNGKKITRYFQIPMPDSLDKFKNIFQLMFKDLNTRGKIKKIGIGVAGQIKGTKVIRATNIPYFKNFDFKKVFPKVFLRVNNDARTYAQAEYAIGSGKGAKSILVITLGTGIGRAYGKNGKIKNLKTFETNEPWEKEYQKIKDKNKLAKFLSEKLAPIIYTLDPEIVVLGGGVVNKKGYFSAIKKALNKKCRSLPAQKGVKIEKSKLGKFAGAIGATMLFPN